MRLQTCMLLVIFVSFGTIGVSGRELQLSSSRMSQELLQMRYQGVRMLSEEEPSASTHQVDQSESVSNRSSKQWKRKSAPKAFAMSLVIPGLGQFYYGSRVKAALFFGADVAFWALASSSHKKGNELTDEFNAFNRAHWNRDSYEQKYLLWTYGFADDEEIPTDKTEISHHLPDTETQQYFEMTGKYNQFAWGWDDAELNGKKIDDYSVQNPPLRILEPASTPYSQNRLTYEDMRHSANKKFEQSRAMIMLAMANRIISSFEALFTVNRHNRGLAPEQQFSRVEVRASLKSYRAKRDTPFLKLTYRF